MNNSKIENLLMEQRLNEELEAENQHVSQPNANTNVVGSLLGQREIKFRLWLPSIRKMTHSLSIKDWANGYEQITISDDCIWMQYTGREDAQINGNEVYEYDIIENCDTKDLQVVYWNEDESAWYCRYVNDEKRIVSLADSLGNLNKKVGNFFENPELLHSVA